VDKYPDFAVNVAGSITFIHRFRLWRSVLMHPIFSMIYWHIESFPQFIHKVIPKLSTIKPACWPIYPQA
jgi:hypothetical protein